jgi:rod shape-determining protein MreC
MVMLSTTVLLCLISLGTGVESTFLHSGIKKAVAMTAFPFLKAKSLTGDGVDYVMDLVFRYDAIRKENDSLKNDIIRLKIALAHRAEQQEENKRLHAMIAFAQSEPRFDLVAAKVIESYKDTLRIDCGTLRGVARSMAVITEKGVVGIVTEVDPLTAIVATLHHPDCRIGAMVLRNRIRAYDGVIHSGGSDLNRLCTMDYIDMKNEVMQGDPVVTNPDSLFPAGYPIGRVIAPPHESGSLWKTAEIMPSVDPYRLDEVFVIRRASPETDELAGPPPSALPESASKAPKLPDDRPVQERYAP